MLHRLHSFTAVMVAGGLACMAEAAPRPNIVLIMADDMGFSDVGCYGSEIATPNLDRMAGEGLRFSQFYNAGRCCPTRASLMTGLYSHQAGIGHMAGDRGIPSYQGYLNDRCVTIAEVLKGAGYTTLIAGKWHVGSKQPHWPMDRGFDRFYGTPEGGGFYFKVKPGRTLVLDDKPVEPQGDWYTTDAFTDCAIRFVKQATDRGKPFFLYVAYNAPHWPLQARPRDIARYRGKYTIGWDKIRQQRYRRMIELGVIKSNWAISPRDPKSIPWLEETQKAEMDLRMAVYAAQIDSMDQNIGRILQTLKKAGVEDDTLVLFLMDNGGCAEGGRCGFTRGEPGAETGTPESYASYGLSWANASNTPFRRYKHWVHEGGIATPLIARWPQGIKRRGELEHQPGHVIDIMATCVDLAGAVYPETFKGKSIIPLEGRSLVPAFEGETIDREALYWEHEGNRAVRAGKWKLVAVHGGDWELYDLETDRPETKNLADRYPDRVKEMAAKYEAWADRAGVKPWPVKQRNRHKQSKQQGEHTENPRLSGFPCAAAGSDDAGNSTPEVAAIKVLSTRGSTRATFYPQSNKIVTLERKTHVAWLDSISEIMVATYDHARGKWSPAVKVGTGHDNHGGPALTCDSEGYLHIIFGPHHGPFQHCRSARPNDASRWTRLPDFGENATYPSVVCDEKDTLHVIYRGGGNPRKLIYQRRDKGGRWTEPRILARAPIKSGYTHYHCELAIAPDAALHLAYDVYFNGTARCAGHMMSADRGDTWTLADGSPLTLPVTPESDAFFKRAEPTLRTFNIVCDTKGHPWINVIGPQGIELYHHDGKRWHSMPLARSLLPEIAADQLGGYASMTVDAKDRLYVMTTLAGSVVLLSSADKGKTFQLLSVLPRGEKLPHRGPNLERPTGHHRVDVPWLLFCTGEKGTDCFGKGLYNVTRAVRLDAKSKVRQTER